MSTDHVPDYLVERVAHGDLPPDVAREVEARLQARGESDRIEKLRAANEAFLTAHPVRPAIVAIEERRARGGRASHVAPKLFALAGVGVAALAFVVIGGALRSHSHPATHDGSGDGGDEIRAKSGAPHLSIFRKTATGAERVDERSTMRAGDVVQIQYFSGGAKYGVIASLDALGNVTLHLPEAHGPAATLRAAGTVESAFQLDASPGYEKFFFVTANERFSTADIVGELRSKHSPSPRFDRSVIVLQKDKP